VTTQRVQWPRLRPTTPRHGRPAGLDPPPGASGWWHRVAHWARASRLDLIWVGFVALNLLAMRLEPSWGTVPFLAIWVSLTAIYGVRLWRLQPTILTLAAVTLATGGIIVVQVLKGQQDADYLAEVPLIALMFLVMVWHGRRRVAAMEDKLAAMEAVQRVSQENLHLLTQQHRFLQDASHELGTPITVALGHAELMERAAIKTEMAEDARVVADELRRLGRLATRILLLASASSPDFLHREPVAIESVLGDALERWGYLPRQWRLGSVTDATVLADRDRLALALDALLENAIAHTGPGDQIEVSARRESGQAVLAVADSGCGIDAADLQRIFQRFARASTHRNREAGGFGLGLAIVQAIATAHHGSVKVRSTPGHGAIFEIFLPLAPADTAAIPAAPGTTDAAGGQSAAAGGLAGTLAPGRPPADRPGWPEEG
jgi:signal transduction histidine kinase